MKSRVFTENKIYERKPSFSSNDWTHICTTWTPMTVRLYINGTGSGSPLEASGTYPDLGDNTIILGETTTIPKGTHVKNFIMDEFAFWHRDALSDTEILNLYNSY